MPKRRDAIFLRDAMYVHAAELEHVTPECCDRTYLRVKGGNVTGSLRVRITIEGTKLRARLSATAQIPAAETEQMMATIAEVLGAQPEDVTVERRASPLN